MAGRRATETYFLGVIAVLIAIFGLFTLLAIGLTTVAAIDMISDKAGVGWADIGGGVAFATIGAALTWGAVRFHRSAERRGLIHPPGS